jgi:hypothetical protein
MNAFLILDKTIKSMLAWMKSLPPATDNQSFLGDPIPGLDLYHYGDNLDKSIHSALLRGPGTPEYQLYFGHHESKTNQVKGDTDKDNFYHHKEFGTL